MSLSSSQGFLEPVDILALHECHPLLSHLICACEHLRHHDFLWLAEYNIDWASQDALNDDKAYAFLACLLHYNLSVVHTIWFLGNNYTGEYHTILWIVASLHTHGIAKSLIVHYSRVMAMGCPNHFKATTTRDNTLCTGERATTPPSVPRSIKSWPP